MVGLLIIFARLQEHRRHTMRIGERRIKFFIELLHMKDEDSITNETDKKTAVFLTWLHMWRESF
jgi:hypothetical protein